MKAFYEISQTDYEQDLHKQIADEIEGKGKGYIIGVDESDFKSYLIDKYRLEPIAILNETEKVKIVSKKKEWREERLFRERYEVEVYEFNISYQFNGTPELFRVMPNRRTVLSQEINLYIPSSIVSFVVKVLHQDTDMFNQEKAKAYRASFANVEHINDFVVSWNGAIDTIITNIFDPIKQKYLKENDFFTAINLQIDKKTTSVFSPPTIKKKNIPQPTISEKGHTNQYPHMNMSTYEDILRVIFDFGKSMERKPSTYEGKDEEALRDQFLLILETRYEGTTATGETFNRGGKTDIILKFAKDGSNLFVAECKFWHGLSGYYGAISQLFDRYLTWRDSKTALILFVKNKDMTSVLTTIVNETKNHPYFVRENGMRGDTSISYIFCLPQDKNKIVYLEIILLHFDK